MLKHEAIINQMTLEEKCYLFSGKDFGQTRSVERLGIYFDEKINDRLRGVSRMASLDIILERAEKEYTQEEKEAFATEKNDTYRELLKNMNPADLTDEVRDTLAELRNRGYKLSIGSSSTTSSSSWDRSAWATSLTPLRTAPTSPTPSPIPDFRQKDRHCPR